MSIAIFILFCLSIHLTDFNAFSYIESLQYLSYFIFQREVYVISYYLLCLITD